MKAKPPATEVNTGQEARAPLKVVLLHDGAEAAHRAIHHLRGVVNKLGGDLPVDVCLWHLAELSDRLSGSDASLDLAASDWLVISVGEEASLTTFVRARLVKLMRQKQGQDAMMAVLTPNAMESSSVAGSLHLAAHEAGAHFYFAATGARKDNPDSSCAAIHNRATATTPVLERIMNRASCKPREAELPVAGEFLTP